MLYLAEVLKKSGGFIGGGKAELKLLACQRSEQNWVAIPGDETLPSDEANSYAAGALVLADVSNARQVTRLQEAGRPLVSILQNFSRLQEKFKTQEDEIEQWKQSLTYQSQELNRREMEMETRREELQQMEEDFEHFEQQRQELEALQEEINQQRESYDRNRQELEGAWEHLRGEMRRFEEQQCAAQPAVGLDEEKARSLQALVSQLAGAVPAVAALREQVNGAFEILNQHQEQLGHHWQTLEQQRSQAQQQQTEIDHKAQTIHTQWQDWHRAQEALEQARAELKAQQRILTVKQEYAQLVSVQLQNQDELQQLLYRAAENSDSVKLGLDVDVEALEKMPLDDLQRITQDLESELVKLSQFVGSQEEELNLKQDEINELKVKIEAASDFDRLNLENDLTDEEDGYQMLLETLVGQRRSLQTRKGILSQHQSILRRRQGIPDPDGHASVIDLGPIVSQVENLRQQQAAELQQLEGQITQMQATIQQTEQMVTSQAVEQENKRSELKQLEFDLTEQKVALAEGQGQVKLYEGMLQPVQDAADAFRQKLEAFVASLDEVETTGNQQQQSVAEMQQLITSLTTTPEFAVS